jgi:diadenosine tetraphosphate (Ap4A) HIT family hydrolase
MQPHYPSVDADGECIFCGIARGAIHTPGVFWENEEFMAFLSLWPNTEGFSVLIPKAHYPSDVLAMPDAVLGRMMSAAKEVSRILIRHFDDVGRVGMIAEGTGVDHAHIKLVPMHGTGYMKAGKWQQHPSTIEQVYETYPGYIASNEGLRVSDTQIAHLAEKLRTIRSEASAPPDAKKR